jgi:hypothetical protein
MATSKKSHTTIKKDNRAALRRDSLWTENPLDFPEEWDFRRVHENQLEAAIYYEYARSCEWVCEVFKRWHDKRFKRPKGHASLGQWAGKTVREILQQSVAEELPAELGGWLSDSMPKEFRTYGLLNVWRVSGRFPAPFLKEAHPETSHLDLLRYRRCPAFWEVRAGQPNPPMVWHLNSPPVSSYVLNDVIHEDHSFLREFSVAIDLRFSKTSIKEHIGQWVDTIDDSKVEKLKFGKGKAASTPWVQLKELAAYRLSREAGMKYELARAIALERLKKYPIDNPPDVLPIYARSTFSEALQNAQNRIQTLFPKPPDGSPIA